jgi:Phage integrase, N-terminal SAM-like domain
VTHLRKRMLEELQRRNYSEGTTRAYLQAVQQFAVHFGKSPDKLGPDDLRSYQAYLLIERKLAVASVVARVAAWSFIAERYHRVDFGGAACWEVTCEHCYEQQEHDGRGKACRISAVESVEHVGDQATSG